MAQFFKQFTQLSLSIISAFPQSQSYLRSLLTLSDQSDGAFKYLVLFYREQKIKERCQKCKKRNFRSRNEEFCSEKCSDQSETENGATDVSQESETESTTMKVKKARGQKRNNKNKKSKEERQKIRENRKKNRSKKNNKNTNKKFAVPLNEEEIEVKEYVNKKKVGPLQSFIKFLFKKN